jgi:hypothetical protein
VVVDADGCRATVGSTAVACPGLEEAFGSQAMAMQARLKAATRGNTDERSESWVIDVLYGTSCSSLPC